MAQAPGGMRRVAYLGGSNAVAASHRLKALADGLTELGWVQGRNLRLDLRYAEGDASRYRPLATELLGQKPDVIIASDEHIAQEVLAIATTVPIVAPIGFDPVGTGLVRSLARPGGNVTGISVLSVELMPKRLQLLKEVVPGLTRVALLYQAGDPRTDLFLKSLAEPARKFGITIIPSEFRDDSELERAFENIAQHKVGAILTVPGAFFFQHRTRVADLAIKHALAYATTTGESVRVGALFSYGPDFPAIFRQSARLIDKILRGENPANIPVEQANVYELVVNLKTARAPGIKLPRLFLLQATQTIE